MDTIATKDPNFMHNLTLRSKNNQSNEQANKQKTLELEREKRTENYSFNCKLEIFYNLYKRLTCGL